MPIRITKRKLMRLHEAAKKIEVDGFGAFHSTCDLAGREIALALLIAHVRRNCGSMKEYPPRDEIVDEVNEALVRECRFTIIAQ